MGGCTIQALCLADWTTTFSLVFQVDITKVGRECPSSLITACHWGLFGHPDPTEYVYGEKKKEKKKQHYDGNVTCSHHNDDVLLVPSPCIAI